MGEKKSLEDDLSENKAVQAGGATLVAVGAAKVGLATGALGVTTATKVGVLLATATTTLGAPVVVAAGAALLVGGVVATIVKRMNDE